MTRTSFIWSLLLIAKRVLGRRCGVFGNGGMSVRIG